MSYLRLPNPYPGFPDVYYHWRERGNFFPCDYYVTMMTDELSFHVWRWNAGEPTMIGSYADPEAETILLGGTLLRRRMALWKPRADSLPFQLLSPGPRAGSRRGARRRSRGPRWP